MITLLVAITAVLAACGSSGDTAERASGTSATAVVDDAVVAVGDAPNPTDGVGSLGDAVEVAAGAIGQADAAACELDRQTVQGALEMFEALNGSLPASEDDLVAQQLIKEPSALYDLDPTGAIIPVPGGPCA